MAGLLGAINAHAPKRRRAQGGAALYAYAYEYDTAGNVKKVAETYPDASKNRVVENRFLKEFSG